MTCPKCHRRVSVVNGAVAPHFSLGSSKARIRPGQLFMIDGQLAVLCRGTGRKPVAGLTID